MTATLAPTEVRPMTRRRIDFAVWIADLTYTQQTIAADVMPNAIGGIATFAEAELDMAAPIRLFKYPEKLIEALERGPIPRVIGFSNYVWNCDLASGIARLIRKHAPETVIVFGGPNYSVAEAEQDSWLRARSFIDFYIVKEGEAAFARLLIALVEAGFDLEAVKRKALPSIHAIGRDGTAYLPDELDRIRDLAAIPSAYASGKLDEFFDGMLLPIIQTNRGCPFSCTFCVEGVGYYNKIHRNSGEKVAVEVDYIGRRMAELRAKGGRNDLFIADSNFGMYREDLDTCRELAKARKLYQWPEYINVATGKNQKERVLEASRLIDGALRLSGSVQSLDPDVLKNIKRNNIAADGLMDLALRAAEVGANSYSEIILGLPGDSKAAHYRTVRMVMDAGFTNIYLFQLMLLPGTELATPATKAEYGMDCRYRVLPRCYGHYRLFGEDILAAEIEEICVATRTLSFADYLDCRRMHLIVTLFHNDGIFGTLLKLLRSLKVSVWRWIELMMEIEPAPGLARLFDSFRAATESELWRDRAALEAFTRTPGNVEKFVAGELGNNLLFVHKTIAITRHLSELADLARRAALACLAEAGHGDATMGAFVEDALAWHVARMSRIFEGHHQATEATLGHDVGAFEDDAAPKPPAAYRLAAPTPYRFVLDQGQKTMIERYLGIYGDTPVGIGRILSKVYVKKLFRHPQTDAPMAGESSEARYRIAGLQH
ncbi:MAG: radical SAM protein [Alphaproteobacteria bacterium]|nr:radical SAM protein [Alphaproteobacteria bacterium]